MPKPIVSGARCRLSFAGVKVGYATNVSVYEGIQYEPLNVLDNIETEEHVPVGYDVRGSFGSVRVVLESLKAKGLFPRTGQTPAEHLTNILNMGEIEAQIEDVPTGKVIMQLTGVKLSERNLSVQPRSITGEEVSFVAKRARDEADLAT